MSRAAALGVAATAAAARLAMVAWAWGRVPPAADGTYYHQLAARLAAGHGYTWLWPDGAVTYAAHYPVGYPAVIAALYAPFGAHPGWAMLLNAALGTLGALAVHGLLTPLGRRLALAGGLLVALHPALVAYTPAVMTEGVAASLVACAAWSAARARRSPQFLWVTAAVLSAAILVRPQCLLLAPVLGMLGRPRAPLRAASLVTALALLGCLPWTLRNCRRMDRCALVSVNGGWNLLIGTQPEGRGGWSPLEVPAECREVFDEAGKDRCFEAAARRRIAADPIGWLKLAPAKLSVTFDYAGAAGWYLREASPQHFSERAKLGLGVVETLYARVLLLLALVGALSPSALARRRWGALALALAGIAAALSRHGWLAHLVLVALLARRGRGLLRLPAIHGAALGTVGSMAAVHGAFFGAGRYQLLAMPLVAGLAAIGAARLGPSARALSQALRHREGRERDRAAGGDLPVEGGDG